MKKNAPYHLDICSILESLFRDSVGFLMKILNPTIADEIDFFFERDHPRAKAMFLPVVDPINQFNSRCFNIARLASRHTDFPRIARIGKYSLVIPPGAPLLLAALRQGVSRAAAKNLSHARPRC